MQVGVLAVIYIENVKCKLECEVAALIFWSAGKKQSKNGQKAYLGS